VGATAANEGAALQTAGFVAATTASAMGTIIVEITHRSIRARRLVVRLTSRPFER
jgi:hypothetical protein